MKIKVFGKNGKSRIMTANSPQALELMSKCFDRWEFVS